MAHTVKFLMRNYRICIPWLEMNGDGVNDSVWLNWVWSYLNLYLLCRVLVFSLLFSLKKEKRKEQKNGVIFSYGCSFLLANACTLFCS